MKTFRYIVSLNSAPILLAITLLLTGCQTGSPLKPKTTPYQPGNFSSSRTHLTPEIVTVAVMPPEVTVQLASGHEATLKLLEQIHGTEVMKTHAFAVRLINEDMLKSLVGRKSVSANQPFPAEFFDALRENLSCQAVLISELTALKTMAPMKMGWHMKLIDTESLEAIWEIDEFYDAGNIHVAAAAEEYYETKLSGAFRKPDPELVLASPRLFGQYTLDSVLSTLPPRQ